MPEDKKIKLGGGEFYYVAVDGTDSVDSAEFGVAIEEFGFRNLYGEKLKDNVASEASAQKARLEDPNHGFLPIWKVLPKIHPNDPEKSTGVLDATKGIAVVCPCGLNSGGADEFWPDKAKGIKDSTLFMQKLILNPGVYLNGKKMGLAAGMGVASSKVLSADIVTLSSHGWLGGFMSGNNGYQWMIIGGVAADPSLKFEGPVWLILAQCSTVCIATWPSWVTVMARSIPAVRGVLAYEEVAPSAGKAVRIARQFFNAMKGAKPKSFVDAWKVVNNAAGRSWAAIVHKDAVNDTLSQFHKLPKIDVTNALDAGVYLGWSQTKDDAKGHQGVPIHVAKDPFAVRLRKVSDKNPADAKEYNQTNLNQAVLRAGSDTSGGIEIMWEYHYEVTLIAPKGSIVSATIEWVHIRRTKPKFDSRKIFGKDTTVGVDPGVTAKYVFTGTKKTDKGQYELKVDKTKKLSQVVARFHPVDGDSFAKISGDVNYKGDDKLVAHHSYLWVYASITLDDGTVIKPYEFTTRGLVFYGSH